MITDSSAIARNQTDDGFDGTDHHVENGFAFSCVKKREIFVTETQSSRPPSESACCHPSGLVGQPAKRGHVKSLKLNVKLRVHTQPDSSKNEDHSKPSIYYILDILIRRSELVHGDEPFDIAFPSTHHSPSTVNRKARELVIGTVRLNSTKYFRTMPCQPSLDFSTYLPAQRAKRTTRFQTDSTVMESSMPAELIDHIPRARSQALSS